jgi:hypothetical protein
MILRAAARPSTVDPAESRESLNMVENRSVLKFNPRRRSAAGDRGRVGPPGEIGVPMGEPDATKEDGESWKGISRS